MLLVLRRAGSKKLMSQAGTSKASQIHAFQVAQKQAQATSQTATATKHSEDTPAANSKRKKFQEAVDPEEPANKHQPNSRRTARAAPRTEVASSPSPIKMARSQRRI